MILRAASREFRAKGFHATGMRDIAAALGMTVGNLYYYFENKQELLAFCQEEALSRLLKLAAWVRSLPVSSDQRVYLLIVGHVVCLNEGTPGSLAHLQVEELGREWRTRVIRKRDKYERLVRELVEEGIAAGVFRTTDAKVAALAILGAVNWTVKWFHPEGKDDARTIGKTFAEQLVAGLMQTGAKLRAPTIEVPSFERTIADELRAGWGRTSQH